MKKTQHTEPLLNNETPSKGGTLWLALLGNAIVASALTSTAYLVGVVFQQQYMKALKFNFELYPKSSSDYFLYSFTAFFQMFPAWLVALGSGFKIVLIVATFSFFFGIG